MKINTKMQHTKRK